MASRSGISNRHGGHHVAQKFTRTISPRSSESVNFLLCRSVQRKVGLLYIGLVGLQNFQGLQRKADR